MIFIMVKYYIENPVSYVINDCVFVGVCDWRSGWAGKEDNFVCAVVCWTRCYQLDYILYAGK